jgi:hypothetical protein
MAEIGVATIIGISLAAPGLIKLFFDCTSAISSKVKEGGKFKKILKELEQFEIEDQRAYLQELLELGQSVLKYPNVSDDQKEQLNRSFNSIISLLDRMKILVPIALSGSFASSDRYRAKSELKELGKTKKLSQSVAAFRNMVSVLREKAAQESAFFFEDGDFSMINPEERFQTPGSSVFIAKGLLSRPRPSVAAQPGWFLFEPRPYTDRINKSSLKRSLRFVSQKLSQKKLEGGILSILGFRDDHERGEFQLVFHGNFKPETPTTLLTLMHGGCSKPSLNIRIDICYKLAEAVLESHNLGIVHKNIRPENILLSIPVLGEDACAKLSLLGWQYASLSYDAGTLLMGEITLQRKIYQHRERQTQIADNKYCMGHDIYSLGVCMIEILTWDLILPAVPRTPDDGAAAITEYESCVSAVYMDSFTALGFKADATYQGNPAQDLAQIQQTLLRVNQETVPREAGNKMKRLINNFTTCLDEGNDAPFGMMDKRDSKDIAMDFIENALSDIRGVWSVL